MGSEQSECLEQQDAATRELEPEPTVTLTDSQESLEAESGTEEPGGQLDFGEVPLDSGEKLPLKKVLEAMLFAASTPLSLDDFHTVLKDFGAYKRKQIKKTLEAMMPDYQGTGFELVESFGGYQMRTRSLYAPFIRKLLTVKKKDRLSKSALETLAIIAYKQPISRAEVESIRGVNVDSVMRVLLEKDLIYQSGKKDIPGKPPLYSTTRQFLANFGLKSTQELPPLAEWSPN